MPRSVLLALFGIFCIVYGQSQCTGSPNLLPISTADPILQKTVTNGKLYYAGAEEPYVRVIQVWGTAYERGFAIGSLVKEDMQVLIPSILVWIDSQIEQNLQFLPVFLQELIAEYGSEAALDLTYELTYPFTPQYFYAELQGLADASGIDYNVLVRVHMLPELVQAHCSMFGAWGPAIANITGSLYQLRALDWSTDGPFQQFPAVTIYHPTDGGHNYSIVGWSGWIGALSGFSSSPMGICEKVWLSYNGTQSRSGVPWMFLLRDILQFDESVDDAISRISNADRTCSIFVGVGDQTNGFRAIEYSYETVNIWDDVNQPSYTNHPIFPGLVYIDKHVQPSQNPCFGELMQKFYGNFSAVNTLQYITAIEQTGNMHIAFYDYAAKLLYVGNASPAIGNATVIPAYDRSFTRLNMTALFTEQPPQVDFFSPVVVDQQ